jgi:hypothetical protein
MRKQATKIGIKDTLLGRCAVRTMHDWMMNGWGSMGGFGFILWLLILGAIIAGVVWFVRSQPLPAPLVLMCLKSATHAETRDEYLQMKRDITE